MRKRFEILLVGCDREKNKSEQRKKKELDQRKGTRGKRVIQLILLALEE